MICQKIKVLQCDRLAMYIRSIESLLLDDDAILEISMEDDILGIMRFSKDECVVYYIVTDF